MDSVKPVRLSVGSAVATAALALAACTSSAPHAAPAPRPVSASPVVSSAATPGCSAASAPGRQLPAGLTRLSSVPGDPFGVAVTADGRWSFVSLVPDGSGGAIGVFADTGSATPRLVRQIPVSGQPLGVALTPGGRYLLAANGSGATVVSVQAAEQGGGNAVLGTLSTGGGTGPAAGGAIEVAVSNDGRFAFVSLETSGKIAVFNLQQALASHFRTSGFAGDVPAGVAPVGLAVSPDGDWLYSTSELRSMSEVRRAERHGSLSLRLEGGQGTLAVISVPKAETDPARAIVSTVTAGCSPVRVITSANGGMVWVTARGSDMLLGFSASRLRGDPAHALIARAAVGEAPVGLALVDNGQRVVVADSNRFGQPGAKASLAVVNVAAALAHRPALAGYLPAGGFPRQMALEPDGRVLLVTDFASRQLETVNVTNLP
jgi:DNA-binding beta-propeller fold protein YncE